MPSLSLCVIGLLNYVRAYSTVDYKVLHCFSFNKTDVINQIIFIHIQIITVYKNKIYYCRKYSLRGLRTMCVDEEFQ